MHAAAVLFTAEVFKRYFQVSFLCGVLWKLGKCEKWLVMGQWQIRMINLKSTIINTAIYFKKQLNNNEIV